MSHPEDSTPQAQTESSEQPRTFYEPLTTVEDVTAKLEALQSIPAEEVTDRQIFEVIADAFVTRCEEYRRAGIQYEYGEEVEWKLADERGFETDGKRDCTIGYHILETSNGLNKAWFEDNNDNLTSIYSQGGHLEIHETDFGVEPEVDTVLESLPVETKTRILSSLQRGLNSPLGKPR